MRRWAHVLIAVWQLAWVVGWVTLLTWLGDRYDPTRTPDWWLPILFIPVLFIPVIAGYTLYEMRYGRRR